MSELEQAVVDGMHQDTRPVSRLQLEYRHRATSGGRAAVVLTVDALVARGVIITTWHTNVHGRPRVHYWLESRRDEAPLDEHGRARAWTVVAVPRPQHTRGTLARAVLAEVTQRSRGLAVDAATVVEQLCRRTDPAPVPHDIVHTLRSLCHTGQLYCWAQPHQPLYHYYSAVVLTDVRFVPVVFSRQWRARKYHPRSR